MKVNLIEKMEQYLGEDEKILNEVIVIRKLVTFSTVIALTSKRVIYYQPKTFASTNFESIDLENIRSINYLPQALHTGGILKVLTRNGKSILITPSFISLTEADEFLAKFRELKKESA